VTFWLGLFALGGLSLVVTPLPGGRELPAHQLVIGAVGASVWLGPFAFKHVDYSRELWWQFELQGDASRFLRASVGAAVVLLLFGLVRLIRYASHEAPAPTQADLQDAGKAIAAQTSAFPNLAFLKDKALLFDDTRSAFVMYTVQGRTWAALGDPVGPEERLTDLVRLFLERCADFGGVPVFYEVSRTHLHRGGLRLPRILADVSALVAGGYGRIFLE
jgi:phosphatidylglycerol lysyltransferase